jgi:hypothetical protein
LARARRGAEVAASPPPRIDWTSIAGRIEGADVNRRRDPNPRSRRGRGGSSLPDLGGGGGDVGRVGVEEAELQERCRRGEGGDEDLRPAAACRNTVRPPGASLGFASLGGGGGGRPRKEAARTEAVWGRRMGRPRGGESRGGD